MFKMQTELSEKNVATDKKHILRKINLKFQNSKSGISCKIAFYILFCYKLELLGVKRSMKHKHKWMNKIACFSFLKN